MAWKTLGGGDTSDLAGGDRDFGNFCFIKLLTETELLASGASSEPLAMPPDDAEEGSQSQALPKSARSGRKRKFLYDVYFMHFLEMKTEFVPMVTKFYSTFDEQFWATAGLEGAETGARSVGARESDGAASQKRARKQSKAVLSALKVLAVLSALEVLEPICQSSAVRSRGS
eukprot:1569547-Rhodomonas_salina.2